MVDLPWSHVRCAVIILVRTFVSTYTVYWGLALGIISGLVIFFMPNGVLGWLLDVFKRKANLAEVKE